MDATWYDGDDYLLYDMGLYIPNYDLDSGKSNMWDEEDCQITTRPFLVCSLSISFSVSIELHPSKSIYDQEQKRSN